MSRVHRRGMQEDVRRTKRRAKRPCYSAPAAPTNVTLTFGRREVKEREEWRAITTWDPVTQDASGRAINVAAYRVQLRATDASGEPVETVGQSQTFTADGADFTVAAGSCPTNGRAREIDGSPDEIRYDLTGLTAGIEARVHLLAAKGGASAPTLRFAVWDTTANQSVVSKDRAPDKQRPTTVATMAFTPVAGRSYQVRVSYVSGTGTALVHQAQWHDTGSVAIWSTRIEGDDDARVVFPIVRPRTWYYQTRVGAARRVAGRLCWGAWSAWTTPVQPATGALVGPPAPTGVTLSFVRDESRRGSPWVAKAEWNEVPWWIAPDGEAQEGAVRYDLKLEVRPYGGSSATNVRRVTVHARDQDADTSATYTWGNITRKREYRFAVRAVDAYGRRGAWAGWTAWSRPPKISAPVVDVQLVRRRPRSYVATWSPPSGSQPPGSGGFAAAFASHAFYVASGAESVADDDAVIGYRVRWYVRRAGVWQLVETQRTVDLRSVYHVPREDRGRLHRVEVVPLYEGSVEEGDDVVVSAAVQDDELWIREDLGEAQITDTEIALGSVSALTLVSESTAVYSENDQQIPTDTDTVVGFNRIDHATPNFAPNLADDTITLDARGPEDSGVYLIVASCRFSANATGRRQLSMERWTGSTWQNLPGASVTVPAVSGAPTDVQVTWIGRVAVSPGETRIRAVARQTSGQALQMLAAGKRLAVIYVGAPDFTPTPPSSGRPLGRRLP